MISIRAATAADVALIVRLRTEFMRELRGQQHASLDAPDLLAEATTAYLERAIPSGQYRGWLAETDTGDVAAMVGCFFFERPPMERPGLVREGRIVNVYTRPDWRGRGLARRLLDEAIGFARANAVRRLRLGATDLARPLYASLGFRPVLTEMELSLAAPRAAAETPGAPAVPEPTPAPDATPTPVEDSWTRN